MRIYETRSIAGATRTVIIGGFLCLAITLLAIASVIVLSLISVYTPNHGQPAYGEQYQLKGLFLKVIYPSTASTYNNSKIVDSTTLSTLCGTNYQNSQGAQNFVGCLASNFSAYGPYNASMSRRRRIARDTLSGMYEIGNIDLYYSTSCGKKGDVSQYANAPSLSSCVKKRLNACNSFVNSSTTLIQWASLPTSFSQSITNQAGNGFDTISVQEIFAIPFSIASSLVVNLSLPTTTLTNIGLGCQYIGPLPMSSINNAFLAQVPQTTTSNQSNSTG